jgi:hypothetical protein
MAAWGVFAIVTTVMIALSLWRLAREARRPWWPGVGMFVVAALAMIVLAGDDAWTLPLFGGVILASDLVLLRSVLVTSLCARSADAEDAP